MAQTWYFVFPDSHEHKGKYIKIDGITGLEARCKFAEIFGNHVRPVPYTEIGILYRAKQLELTELKL